MVTDFEHVDDVLFKTASKGAEDRRFVAGAGQKVTSVTACHRRGTDPSLPRGVHGFT